MSFLRQSVRIAYDAFMAFLADDGWAIASYIALALLMALFPFLIVVTALAGFFFGSKELADEAAKILLEVWPQQVAGPLAIDVEGVLTSLQGGALTFGAAFAVYFASSGVDSLRIGLNRAYNINETRDWYWLRLESIVYVLISAVAMLAFAFLVVLAPLIWAKVIAYVPTLAPFSSIITFVRFLVAASVIVMALLIVHLWLPAGRRTLSQVGPGILATLVLWLISGEVFGRYLAAFAYGYITMYAGLASAMIALVFLYITASIFIYGGELNAEIAKAKHKAVSRPSPRARPRKSAGRRPGN